jgi:UDP-GlcNAc:undecaprenyl-phosphate GlcNAc-1-phosphate transferase
MDQLWNYLPLLSAFLYSAGLIALLVKPARVLGWIDRPSDRKHHRDPVPMVGGVAMCVAFCASILLLAERPHAFGVLLICMTMLTLVGLYDDLFSLRPTPRFLCQIGVILLMTLVGNVALTNLGDLFGWGNVLLDNFTIPITIFAVVGVINAFNMIDGLDGLAGGLALLATLCLIILNLLAPVTESGILGALSVLALVIAGFLCFNLRHPWRTRASVFMGDAGSTMLGFVLGWFLVHLSQGREAVMAPVTAIWIVALPLMDTVAVMARRIHAGRSPFAADRQHLHHLLLGLGLTDGRVCAILLAVATLAATGGVLAWWLKVPEHWQFYTFLAMFALYYRLTTRLWTKQQKTADSIFESGRDNTATDLA